MWTQNYDDLLLEWSDLRTQAASLPLEDALHTIQDWWDQAPIVSPFLHITEYEEWPLPWDLLENNGFCDVAKCLGLCYTLLLIQHEDIKSMHIIQTDNYSLLQINNGQYTLNDSLGEITADQSDLRVKYSIDCEYFKNKLK